MEERKFTPSLSMMAKPRLSTVLDPQECTIRSVFFRHLGHRYWDWSVAPRMESAKDPMNPEKDTTAMNGRPPMNCCAKTSSTGYRAMSRLFKALRATAQTATKTDATSAARRPVKETVPL